MALSLTIVTGAAYARTACSAALELPFSFQEGREIEIRSGEVGIFGYGSLLNLKSLGKTLDHTYEGPVAVARLSGFERAWSVTLPNKNYHAKTPEGVLVPQNILYLNIEPRATAVTNGAVIVVKDSEVSALDRREWVYDRVDVTKNLAGVKVKGGGRIYTYVGKSEFLPPERAAFPLIGVRDSYVDMVEQALTDYDQAFREEYRATTGAIPEGTNFQDYLIDEH